MDRQLAHWQKKGADAFKFDKEAVKKLINYAKKSEKSEKSENKHEGDKKRKDENKRTEAASIIPKVLVKLYNADRLLATVAIDESVCKAKDVAKANKLVAEADSNRETGDPQKQADKTYDKLKDAWEKATKCSGAASSILGQAPEDQHKRFLPWYTSLRIVRQ